MNTLDVLDALSQIGIMAFGPSAIFIVGLKSDWRRWGFVVGACQQPFWIYTTIYHGQWGICLLSFIYTGVWINGIYQQFFRSKGDTVKVL